MKNWLRKFLPPGIIRLSHWIRGLLAALVYGFPAKKLRVIGITGTNGKTTSCFLIASILEAAGHRVGMATTVRFKIGAKEWLNDKNMTTLSPFALQKLLRQMVKEECEFVVLEATSHAIDQKRIWGIPFEVIGLTNLTHEHLDYHGTFEDYKKTKGRLFNQPHRIAVINRDDPSADYFLKLGISRKITFGIEKKADISAKKIFEEPEGSIFIIISPAGQIAINLKLPGFFNVQNALLAVTVAEGLGIDLERIKEGLEKVEAVPGRMEKVTVPAAKQDFTVIVDYAHSPDALQKLYQTIRNSTRARIIAVFGATGDRDKSKRPLMGAIAGRLCDVVFVTDEEPYSEEPMAIIKMVAEGVPRGGGRKNPKKRDENFFIVPDRAEAIEKAIDMAQRGDTVLVTGMGAQVYKNIKGKKIPWSDKEVIEEKLRGRFD